MSKTTIISFKNFISYLYDSFLNSVYKQKCLICTCAKTDSLLCKTCAKDVHYLSGFAHRIYKNIPIYSASIYQGSTKKLIHKLKFCHKKRASIPLAQILFNYYRKLDLNKNEIIITYPETFFVKNSQRGYNHMFLIAKEFSKLTGCNVIKNLVKKIKPTKPQYKAKNRHKNIKGSFEINKKLIDKIKNKNILLIDDITTSGATLDEIINCFSKVGVNNIVCLTISKTIK